MSNGVNNDQTETKVLCRNYTKQQHHPPTGWTPRPASATGKKGGSENTQKKSFATGLMVSPKTHIQANEDSSLPCVSTLNACGGEGKLLPWRLPGQGKENLKFIPHLETGRFQVQKQSVATPGIWAATRSKPRQRAQNLGGHKRSQQPISTAIPQFENPQSQNPILWPPLVGMIMNSYQ